MCLSGLFWHLSVDRKNVFDELLVNGLDSTWAMLFLCFFMFVNMKVPMLCVGSMAISGVLIILSSDIVILPAR